ncbi:MAG: phosphoribosylglycinamide formyltransferase [Rickettsiaceae bacterium H1]|nr:phosphoribosylglycinamide formyltransferase [Rickettsiaceae bacterium H1]
MLRKQEIAVFISGRGSNLGNLINECKKFSYPAKIECVISSKNAARGIEIAEKQNIPVFILQKKDYEDDLNKILNFFNIKIICLAGFMKILSSKFVKTWKNKIINIHPSLLPSFKGLKAQQQALDAGVKITGCTVHYVDSQLDNGKIIMQLAVPVLKKDTVESLSDRILIAEHKCYPKALKLVLTQK